MNMTKKTIATITLVLMLTVSAMVVALPAATAQEPETSKTYPFIGATPNPAGVNQEVLIHVGITCELPRTQYGWEGLTVTIEKPDGNTDTISDIRTDATGGTGRVYVPDQVGIYYLQTHFPEQEMPADLRRYYAGTVPEGTIMEASESEILELVITEESREYYPGHSLPDEYWTRPIDAQLWEWTSISGSWVTHLGSNEVRYAPYNDGPETAHILWVNPIQTGGLAGGEFGSHSYECGAAYQDKASPRIIIAGVFYTNRFEAQGGTNVEQEVVAIDLHIGEELWSKPLLDPDGVSRRLSFGQQFYWDSYNYHGVFGYLWATSGGRGEPTSWHAFDAKTGRWIYTMVNVPSGTTVYGPKGEIYRYNVDEEDGWMTLWNSSRVVSDRGSWRPHGRIYENADELGFEWNITIPTGLPGSAKEVVLGDRVFGVDISTTAVSAWGFSLKSGEEGKLLFNNTWTPPSDWDAGKVTVAYKGVSLEEGVFVVGVAETRQHWGLSIETCDLLWGPTDPQHYLDYYQNLPSYVVTGKLFSGGMSGITYCYNVTTGKLLWTYEMKDPYSEVTWGENYPRRYPQGFIADGKYYSGYFEHSPIDPKPRGAPFFCLDVETGDEIWSLHSISAASYRLTALIGDSIIVFLDTYDNRIYGIGKGQSATTVTAPDMGVSLGSSVIIHGRVTDESPGTKDYALTARFPDGVPAISDGHMSEWMQYVYQQFERPEDATGVTVKLEAVDPNNQYVNIGETTSDAYGNYGFTFTPDVEGKYMIIATFEGSSSYYGSTTTTYLTVGPAAAPYPDYPEAPAYTTTDLAILAAVIIAIIIGAVSVYITRKQRK